MDDNSIDFGEFDGQLELVIQDLERQEKKKAITYYMNPSTIDRIKVYAQRYNMKDSQFLEEVMIRLMDLMDVKKESARELVEQKKELQAPKEESPEPVQRPYQVLTSETNGQKVQPPTVTPWGRLSAATISKHMPTAVDGERCQRELPEENVGSDIQSIEDMDMPKETPNVGTVSVSEQEWLDYEQKLLNYIFEKYKPDYRLLVPRFVKRVEEDLEIDVEIAHELIRRFDRQGRVTLHKQQNLLDINKLIFEEKMPHVKDIVKYYDQDQGID